MCIEDVRISQRTRTRQASAVAGAGGVVSLPADRSRIAVYASAPFGKVSIVLADATAAVTVAGSSGTDEPVRRAAVTVHTHPGVPHRALRVVTDGLGFTADIVEVMLNEEYDRQV